MVALVSTVCGSPLIHPSSRYQTMYQQKQKAKICTQTIQNGVTKKCSIYHKYKKNKKRNRHQHNTDDGGQAVGEEMRHVQMSR